MKRVLVAGATGYLGQYIVKELKSRGFYVRVLIRKESQKEKFAPVDDSIDNLVDPLVDNSGNNLVDNSGNNLVDDFFIGQITKPDSLKGVTKDIDWVFSTVGITRQKDGMTYMDVDYQGNSNLLKEALNDNVKAFQYISAINGDRLKHLKIFEAKEKFVDELKASGIRYSIMRPNGFFSDMRDFLDMAKSGRVYLFGEGNLKLNPIDGADLAKVCIDKMTEGVNEESVGGVDILTHNQLAELALQAWKKPIKIVHLPDWTRRFAIWLLQTFTSSKTYGPIEFFLTAMAKDNIAKQYGTKRLEDFFINEVQKSDLK